MNLKCKNRSQTCKVTTASGAETYEPMEIANEFKSFSSEVGERMALIVKKYKPLLAN